VTDGVVDDATNDRLVFEQEGQLAELVYSENGDRLTIVHTGVPESLSGRGIAERLVRAALEKAKAGGLTVVPRCPYARTWLIDHPEEAHEASIDWTQSDQTRKR
jgi:uncharacterized protein